MVRILDVSTSAMASMTRLGAGIRVARNLGHRPEQTLEIYEFEACPFCRKVREMLSYLDLDAVIYPCPRGGQRFRPQVETRGGKRQYPYLIDPNTGREMYESDDIIAYLAEHYGDGTIPVSLRLGPLTVASASLASLARLGQGRAARPSRAPEQRLELYSFEGSPFCRLVREALCSLEIPYKLNNVARGSQRRDEFTSRSGKMQVPYLIDPNTGTEMFESAAIIAYLNQTYGESN